MLGVAVSEKPWPPRTVNGTLTVWVMLPLVAPIVTRYVPGSTPAGTFTVISDVYCAFDGAKLTVAPMGNPVALKLTETEKPLKGA